MPKKSAIHRIIGPVSHPQALLAFGAACAIAVIALAGIPGAVLATVDRDQAVAIVTRTKLGGSLDGIRLYVDRTLLRSGETIETWRKDVFTAPASGWLVFVDRVPAANWEHPCWYFFVDAAAGRIQQYDAMTPPRRLQRMVEVTHGYVDNPPPGMSERELQRFSERLRQLPAPPPPTRGQQWAFIISGGVYQGVNYVRYWNDCSFIYRTLRQFYGFAHDHIRVCISDGTDPAPDRADGTNSPIDLDDDGTADTEYPATRPYIALVFEQLAMSVGPDDQLFIFTTDHGGTGSGWDCYLNLWNYDGLRDDLLADHVDTVPCRVIICAFEQCYSGGMIDDLTGDGRVIATACSYDELSWPLPPYGLYDTFVYLWTSAVAWQKPDGTPVDADTDNDGSVSMREAFVYAQENDHQDEHPQYDSTPSDLGDLLNFWSTGASDAPEPPGIEEAAASAGMLQFANPYRAGGEIRLHPPVGAGPGSGEPGADLSLRPGILDRPRIYIHAIDGRLVRTLGARSHSGSDWVFDWDGLSGSDVPAAPGIYFLRSSAPDREGPSRRLVLIAR